MKRFFIGLGLILCGIATWAVAQDISNHAVPVGGGPGAVGWKTAGPCASNQALGWPSGATADPDCINVTAPSGPVLFAGGTSTGSANAQVVSTTNPVGFNLAAGNQVTFIAGFTNTGPTTLNISSTGAVNVFRRSQLGISASVGGEIIAGQSVTVIYDGTQFQWVSTPPAQIGEIKDWAGSTAPPGWNFADNSCVDRIGIFADLFSVIGTTYGGCSGSQFNLPDGRGRVFVGLDNMGGTPANRITSGGSGCNGALLGGGGCGAQNFTISQANLPAYTLPNTLGLNDPGHTHNVPVQSYNETISTGVTAMIIPGGSTTTDTATTGITMTGSVTSGGSGAAAVALPPLQIVNKIIKY